MMVWRVYECGPPHVMRFERVVRPHFGTGDVSVKFEARWRLSMGRLDHRSGLWCYESPVCRSLRRVCRGFRSDGLGRGLRTIGTAATDDIATVRNLCANTVIDFRTQRCEEEVRDANAVIGLVGGDTQERSFQVLRRGGKLISTASRPDQHRAQRSNERCPVNRVRGALRESARRTLP